MRVCVYGAGAIGGHLAVRLAANGHDVAVIARGATLAGIRAHGITITTPTETLTAHPTATDDPTTLGPQDAVIVTAKTPAQPAIAAAMAPLLAPDTPVAFVMNGIPWWWPHDPHGIATHLDPARAIGGVVYSACTITGPGQITVEQPTGRLVLGEPDGRKSDRVARLAAALRCPGLAIDETDAIRDWVWSKLTMNLSGGPIALLTRSAPIDYLAEPALADLSRACAEEAAAIATALGCRVRHDLTNVVEGSRKQAHRPSILQDFEAGRPMETETLFEAPLALARQAGVSTPTLDRLVALVRRLSKNVLF